MAWLNNIKIVFKVGLIVALMATVMIAEVMFAGSRMRAMDDANTDIVMRVDKSNRLRIAERLLKSRWQLC
jgi:hypothetical protein